MKINLLTYLLDHYRVPFNLWVYNEPAQRPAHSWSVIPIGWALQWYRSNSRARISYKLEFFRLSIVMIFFLSSVGHLTGLSPVIWAHFSPNFLSCTYTEAWNKYNAAKSPLIKQKRILIIRTIYLPVRNHWNTRWKTEVLLHVTWFLLPAACVTLTGKYLSMKKWRTLQMILRRSNPN